jgi:uncharacterized protein YjbJ (UPF0337 family)
MHRSAAIMDKDRVKGSATNMGGRAKEAAGDLTGDSKLQSEGEMDQGKVKVQNAIGGIKDAIKGKS